MVALLMVIIFTVMILDMWVVLFLHNNMNKSTDTLKIKNSIFKNNYVKAKHECPGVAPSLSITIRQ